MAVPKKRTSMSKKRIRQNIWKKKGYLAAVKAFSLAKSISTGNSKHFFWAEKPIKKPWKSLNMPRQKKNG
uniref:Large ribosomal subunit protein bL32c n=1 Tax=Enhalus acoroides TaxID=55455 RepID=A0A6M3QGR8_9LILI|nr:ribosomal protein L32 [Enhalus acoroides]YP_009828893.1 ribosomal protein L32 [Enhalus acoroides]QJC59121.1 ribosomal protein L32 [Enhalus acoroides]QJC59125.1 ribosomal protein L32 [Enhalus acoroides]QNH93506.1 ribosomal protein L32 [Enhalus acoroides]QNH93512.1 ribosomal protein L32 [Enhalus acoroides]UWV91991.1 ribosomal protein L32 [Enhalus acoroides]